MSKRKKPPAGLDELQKRAEERLGTGIGPDPGFSTSHADLHRLYHELDVHRIELEMQQEELLKSRAELEESLERYMELYDFAPIGYLSIDRNSKIFQLNLTASSLIGMERSKLIGQRFDSFVSIEDQPFFSNMLCNLFARRQAAVCEVALERPCGASPSASLATGHNISIDNLKTVRIDAVVGDDGLQCRMTLTDVSEQKRVQRDNALLQTTMAQVRKMESIGRLAGGIAHDYNNMLQVMLGNIELMMRIKPELPVDQEKLSDLRHCVLKTASLTRQLLAFARQQPHRPEVLDFSDTVEDMLKMLRRLVGENISITYSHPKERLLVKMDPSQIDQILANLVVNSRDAIQDTGTIRITVSSIVVDSANAEYSKDIPAGVYIRLSVSDDGCGMDSVTLENIFEPFFTTKSVAKGNGLGLASVYGIVKQNGGFINVSSAVGNGARFDVYLPGCTAEELISPTTDKSELVPGGQETILLVEDDSSVRAVTAEFLEQCGYTVIRAATSTSALAAFNAMAGRIDLLVTDFIMPDFNGRELVMKISSIKPGISSLIITGYTVDYFDSDQVTADDLPFISKPYSLSEFARKVREVLDAV
jgi:signal transduction histidine kinase